MVLPAPFGPMTPSSSPSPSAEVDLVDGGDAAVALGDADRLERGRRLGERPGGGLRGCVGAAWPVALAALAAPCRWPTRGRWPAEVHGPQDVVALEQLGGRALEAHLALLHEDGPVGQAQGGGHRLLHEDDGGAVGVDGPHDLEQVLDDGRGQAERQLVDHQQAGPAEERLRQAEHLLLAAGQVAGGVSQRRRSAGNHSRHCSWRSLEVGLLLAAGPAGHAEVLGDGERREHAAPARAPA